MTQATRSVLMSVDSTLSENITAAQDYIPIASTTNFSTSVVAEIESTNEVVSFTDISANEVLYSQTYSNAYWTKANASVTADATTAPDGTTTGTKFDETATTARHRIQRTGVVTSSVASTEFTASVFAKKAERDFLLFEMYFDTEGVTAHAYFDLDNGIVGGTANVSATAMTDEGSGWYRCSITKTASSSATGVRIYHVTATADGTDNYAGSTGNGIYVWGTQLERASSATTYLPTTSAALVGLTGVTRGANGTTAQSASSSDSIQQLPYALSAVNMPTRLRGISVSSDGTGVGRFTLCDKIGTTLCDIDIPDTRIYDLSFGGGIIFPNGVFVSNSDNITGYTLYTDKYSGAAL